MTKALATLQSYVTTSRREEGATAVEYGLMVALIAVVIIVAVAALGTQLSYPVQRCEEQDLIIHRSPWRTSAALRTVSAADVLVLYFDVTDTIKESPHVVRSGTPAHMVKARGGGHRG